LDVALFSIAEGSASRSWPPLALDMLSTYKLKPQPVLYDDPDLELITARRPDMRDER